MDVLQMIETSGGVDETARRLGVDRATIYDWRRNRCVPASRAAQIAVEFSIDLAIVLGMTKQISSRPQQERAA